jgi:hypothetical protein
LPMAPPVIETALAFWLDIVPRLALWKAVI